MTYGVAAIPVTTLQERQYVGELKHWLREESGYAIQQGTRPQTRAYALTDSPAGLAAWMSEEIRAFYRPLR
jgi:microsomal epoxide hydrolase